MPMSTTSRSAVPQLRYHRDAYQFVFESLRHTQQKLGRERSRGRRNEDGHITGQELLEGIRELALQQFGLMTTTVLRQWGVTSTDDFGRIVFELIERGEMRKTDRDQLDDFANVYDFAEAFDREYRIDTRSVFRTSR